MITDWKLFLVIFFFVLLLGFFVAGLLRGASKADDAMERWRKGG